MERKNTVSLEVKQAKTLFEKTKGLLGTNAPSNLLLRTRFGIHTFGMKYPIDVIILDKNNIVKTLKQDLKPNQIFFWNPLYSTVLELREGTINKKRIQKDSRVELLLS